MSSPTQRTKRSSLTLFFLAGALLLCRAAAESAVPSEPPPVAASPARIYPATPSPGMVRTVLVLDRSVLEPLGIRRPTRLAYDVEGNLHVLDAETRRVVKLDGRGRPLFDAGGYGADEASLQLPTDLIVDRNQSLLVLDRVRGALVAFDRAGRYLGLRPFQGVALDEARASGARILLDSFGTLWLLATQTRDLIPLTERLEPARATRYLTPETGIGAPSAAAQAGEGFWIYDAALVAVQRYSSSGRFEFAISAADSAKAFAPSGIAGDSKGNLYVADERGQRLLVFDSSGRLRVERTLGGGSIQWRPTALAVGPGGMIAVSSAERCEIQVFSDTGEAKP